MSRLLKLCDEVERLDKAAVAGPWGPGHPGEKYTGIHADATPSDWVVSPCDDYETPKLPDAELIIHYRSSAPQLARAVRVLYESMERIMDLAHISSSAVGRDIYKETERALEAVEVDEEKKTVKILE